MQRLGSLGHGGVEVEGVGEVELAADLAGAVEGDLLVLDREVPSVGSLGGVFGGSVGHEPGDRLGDQPLQRGDPDAVRERGDLGVHERCRLAGEAEGFLGDPAGPPGLQVAALHPSPDPGQPVLQLHRVRDHAPAGVGGATDGEGELGDAELRDQRRTFAGDRDAGVAGRGDPGGLCADGLRWVLLGPGHRREQQDRVCVGGCGPGLACEHAARQLGESSSPGVIAGGRCHGSIQAATTDRNCRDSPAVEGNSRFFSIRAVVPVGTRRTAFGLV